MKRILTVGRIAGPYLLYAGWVGLWVWLRPDWFMHTWETLRWTHGF